MPPVHSHIPHMFGHPKWPPCVQTPPICPQCSPVHLYVLGVTTCDRGMWAHPYVWTPPCVWMPPQVSQHPHTFICSPTCLYALGIIACTMGKTSHMLGGWGASAHLSGLGCLSGHPLDVHYASLCTFLVVHYVSSLYFTTMTTTPLVTFLWGMLGYCPHVSSFTSW